MCGIAAVLGRDAAEGARLLARLLQRISHRGLVHCRDEAAVAQRWAVGVNRLPIESLPSQRQPRWNLRQDVVLAFNGEVYNWRDLAQRGELWRSGVAVDETQAVTEWLALRGPGGVADFDGMYALAWVDVVRDRFFLARDEFGIKPLYCAQLRGGLVAASEIKALCPEREVAEVTEIPPGSVIEYDLETGNELSASKINEYSWNEPYEGVETRQAETLLKALDASIERCVDTKKSVGVLLSGGLDSGTVLRLARRHRDDVIALTGGKEGSADVVAARALAKELGTELIVGNPPDEESLFATVGDVVRIVESFEPNVVRQGSASLFLARLARENGLEVLLCGEGADELFCGYPEFCRNNNPTELRRRFLSDLHRTQLQRVDRTNMAVTIEVRVPFLMKDIVSFAHSCVPDRDLVRRGEELCVTKVLLREALTGILGDEWRLRPKVILSEGMGFGSNDPESGMFAKLAARAIKDEEVRHWVAEFSDFQLWGAEEVLYFREFWRLGYGKLKGARHRVFANRVRSIV